MAWERPAASRSHRVLNHDVAGLEISAVCWSGEYLELHSDGPLLSALRTNEARRPGGDEFLGDSESMHCQQR
jgi:hypothetical protein